MNTKDIEVEGFDGVDIGTVMKTLANPVLYKKHKEKQQAAKEKSKASRLSRRKTSSSASSSVVSKPSPPPKRAKSTTLPRPTKKQTEMKRRYEKAKEVRARGLTSTTISEQGVLTQAAFFYPPSPPQPTLTQLKNEGKWLNTKRNRMDSLPSCAKTEPSSRLLELTSPKPGKKKTFDSDIDVFIKLSMSPSTRGSSFKTKLTPCPSLSSPPEKTHSPTSSSSSSDDKLMSSNDEDDFVTFTDKKPKKKLSSKKVTPLKQDNTHKRVSTKCPFCLFPFDACDEQLFGRQCLQAVRERISQNGDDGAFILTADEVESVYLGTYHHLHHKAFKKTHGRPPKPYTVEDTGYALPLCMANTSFVDAMRWYASSVNVAVTNKINETVDASEEYGKKAREEEEV